MAFVQALVTPDDVVVGVGFRTSSDILDLSKFSRQVYAFEPNPYAFTRLKKVVRKRENVQLFDVGAGVKEETVMLRLPELADRPQGSRSAPVKFVRLDGVQFGLSPTCLVLNCGGSELEVLRGAEGLFSTRTIRTVLLKSHQLLDERETGPEATLWLLEHGFATEPRKAEDGSLWIIGRSQGVPHASQNDQAVPRKDPKS